MEIEEAVGLLKYRKRDIQQSKYPTPSCEEIDFSILILERVRRLEKALEREVEVGNPLRTIYVLRWLRDGEEW